MIRIESVKRYCSNCTEIENYDKAIADTTQTWVCHHRLETHTSDGERRIVDLSFKELKALGMYYHRLASELIFLTKQEHMSLHWKGKKISEEHRRKNSESHKGKSNGPLSEETKRKISETLKNHSVSEETKRKMSEAYKGKHWKIVEGKRVWY